jgi:hydrogenase expression/formation protein HypE
VPTVLINLYIDVTLLVMFMALPMGKVPPSILENAVFKFLGTKREDVILGPAKGEDAAIVKVGDDFLAMHCDPISGAYGRIGWIAINIATNDIATRGVVPRWVISCIMLPEGADRSLLESICHDMDFAAKRLDVAIVGGHSEVTPGLSHPIVVAFPVGVAQGGHYVTCAGARPGSKIILTKSIALEGTAILANDREETIRRRLGDDLVKYALDYFDDLSVLKEAIAAFDTGWVQAMHDPTEGGLAGGLNEMSDSADVGFRIYENLIPISPETSSICDLFQVNPLSLLSSGSLLIIAKEKKAKSIIRRVENEGVRATIIGEVLDQRDQRAIIRRSGREENLPLPLADEIWSALAKHLD